MSALECPLLGSNSGLIYFRFGPEKSRSPWREGVDRYLVRPIAVEWPLLKVQRSVASQDNEWQVSAADVIGLQNLTDCSQPQD